MDLQITLTWSNAPLPPPHAYSYTLQVGPGTSGRLDYRSGDGSLEWGTEFQLEEGRLDALYTDLTSHNLLREKWTQGEPVDGGSQAWLVIQAGKKVYQTPNIQELADTERVLLENFIEELSACVPQAAWDALHARQAEYVSRSQGNP